MTSLTTTPHKYVQLDERNVPIIAGITMKVVELVMAQIAYGWSPEELQFQHPYLTMSQIHSALAYYWDNKAELDADIKRREEYAEKLRREAGESPFVARLRSLLQGIGGCDRFMSLKPQSSTYKA